MKNKHLPTAHIKMSASVKGVMLFFFCVAKRKSYFAWTGSKLHREVDLDFNA